MQSESTSAQDAWHAHVAGLLPNLRAGHENARQSFHVVVATIAHLDSASISANSERELRLLADVAALDFELKTLLLRLLDAPNDRMVWQKYLALAVWQVLDEVSGRLGPALSAEGRVFKEALKPIRSDKAFVDEIEDIRNRLVAHRSPDTEEPGHLEWAIQSLASQEWDLPALETQLGRYSVIAMGAVHALASAIMRKHSTLFPGAKL